MGWFDVDSNDVLRAGPLCDGNRHQTDYSRTRNQNGTATHVGRHYRVHGVTERIHDGSNFIGDGIVDDPHVVLRELEVLGKGAISLYADDFHSFTDVRTTRSTRLAFTTTDMAFTTHSLPRLDPVDDGADLHHPADEFMTHGDGRTNPSLCPFVPFVDVTVRATDAGVRNRDEHLVRTDLRPRKIGDPGETGCGSHLAKSKHVRSLAHPPPSMLGICKTRHMSDSARLAAVRAALPLVEENTTIGLGSGRALHALTAAIGDKWDGKPPISAVVASSATAKRAEAAGIRIVDLNDVKAIDNAFDGADEIDSELALIKGGGAALLREKLVIAAAKRVIIMAEDTKKVDRLGETRLLPVEVVRFGWEITRDRVLEFVTEAKLRVDESNQPVITDEGHFLLDASIRPGSMPDLARALKGTLGVVDHGLFIDMATDVILGHEDGSATTLNR